MLVRIARGLTFEFFFSCARLDREKSNFELFGIVLDHPDHIKSDFELFVTSLFDSFKRK